MSAKPGDYRTTPGGPREHASATQAQHAGASCVSPALRILLACLAGLFAVAVLIRILYTISGSKEGSKTRVGVTLAKIALSLIQVLTLLEFVLALRWPIG